MTGTSDAADRNSGAIAEFRASHGRPRMLFRWGNRYRCYTSKAADLRALTDLIERIMPMQNQTICARLG